MAPTTYDCAAALDSRFDLIVLDILVPDVDGIEVMLMLRHDYIDTPVVLITGLRPDSELYHAAANWHRGQFVCMQPFNRDELFMMVVAVLEPKDPYGETVEGKAYRITH